MSRISGGFRPLLWLVPPAAAFSWPGRRVRRNRRRSARPQVDWAGLVLSEGRSGRAEDAVQVAASRSPALACAVVAASVFVVYASFGSGAEPQVIGVASSAPRAEELAERYAEEDRCVWRRPNWIEWDSARRVRPAVDVRGNAVEIWRVEVGLDQLVRFALESEPLIEEH